MPPMKFLYKNLLKILLVPKTLTLYFIVTCKVIFWQCGFLLVALYILLWTNPHKKIYPLAQQDKMIYNGGGEGVQAHWYFLGSKSVQIKYFHAGRRSCFALDIVVNISAHHVKRISSETTRRQFLTLFNN